MAISPSRVMATWLPPFTTEAWISGISVMSVHGCPNCCGAAADGRMADSSAPGTDRPHPWVLWPSGTSSNEALKPDTGGSTLRGWLGLPEWTQGSLVGGPCYPGKREGEPPFSGWHVGALGRTVLSQQGWAALWCHAWVTKPVSR